MANKTHKRKKRLIRNAGITATMSMALVLFLIGLLASALFITRDMTRTLKEQMTLSVILKDAATEQQINRIKRFTESSGFAHSVEYISKEQALKEHVEALGENPADFLGWNPLFASLEVKLLAEYAHNDSLSKIEKQLKQFENIEKIAYQKDVIAMINENVRKISIILLGLAAMLTLISFVLINNTIRLRMYSNRFLICTMKLVGAKARFIRKPYIGQSVLSGFVAALIALLMLSGLVYYMKYKFGMDTQFLTALHVSIITGIVLLSGIVLTAVSSYFAVEKYIRMRTDEIYSV